MRGLCDRGPAGRGDGVFGRRRSVGWSVAAMGLLVAASVAHAGAGFQARPGGLERSIVPERYDGHQVVRIVARTPAELMRVNGIAESIMNCRPAVGPLDVQVTPAQRAALSRLGIEMGVLVEDLQALVEAERAEIDALNQLRDTAWFGNWRSLAEYQAFWAQTQIAAPEVVTIDTIGQSLQGRPIQLLTITGPNGSAPIEDRPVILFNGCLHAREWISPMTVTYIADQLARNYGSDPRVTALLDEVVFHIVPMANPDGYEFSWTSSRYWRKNRRNNGDGTWGVDLNRNWGHLWGGPGSSGFGSSDTYRGTAPFSEPETQVLRNLAESTPNLVAHIDYHSYSQLILYPFGGAAQLPPEPDRTFFQNLTQDMSNLIVSLTGVFYNPIASYQLYVAAGDSTDWFYADRGVYSLTVELRPAGGGLAGFNPPVSQILPTAMENYEAALLFAERVSMSLVFAFPEGRPQSAEADSLVTFPITIQNAAEQVDPNVSPRVRFRFGDEGSYSAADLTALGAGLYEVILPTGACGVDVQYYFEATPVGGQVVTNASPEAPYTLSTFDPDFDTIVYEDHCEVDLGWTVGVPTDTATTGIWELAIPQATAAQPGSDHTPGGEKCWVTDGRAGTSLGSHDVDNGATTLTSPRLDATSPAGRDAYLVYHRWYSNDQGANPNIEEMPILISNDDGATWTTLETVKENANAWVRKEFRIADFVEPTDQVRVRFIAQDFVGSIVEAAVDDVLIIWRGCAPSTSPADLTGPEMDGVPDGVVNIADLNYFLMLWLDADERADFTGPGLDGVPDGIVNTADLNYYLGLWLAEQ